MNSSEATNYISEARRIGRHFVLRAAERRQSEAHGASRGSKVKRDAAPTGRKKQLRHRLVRDGQPESETKHSGPTRSTIASAFPSQNKKERDQ